MKSISIYFEDFYTGEKEPVQVLSTLAKTYDALLKELSLNSLRYLLRDDKTGTIIPETETLEDGAAIAIIRVA